MLLLLGVLVLFFDIDWRVGVTMTAFSTVAFLIMLYLRHRAIPFWKEQRQMSALFYGFLSERLGGTEDIRANGATAYILRRFYLLLRQWFPIFKKAIFAGADMGIISLFMFICGSDSSQGLRGPTSSSRIVERYCSAQTPSLSSKRGESRPRERLRRCWKRARRCSICGRGKTKKPGDSCIIVKNKIDIVLKE